MTLEFSSRRKQTLVAVLVIALFSSCVFSPVTSESCREALDNSPRSNFLFEINTTSCFGRCAIHSISINQNGLVEFRGLENVARKGEAKHCIDNDQLSELGELLTEVRFFDRTGDYRAGGDKCPDYYTDHPSVHMSAQLDERQNTIGLYMGCYTVDDELQSLSWNVLGIVGARQYVVSK